MESAAGTQTPPVSVPCEDGASAGLRDPIPRPARIPYSVYLRSCWWKRRAAARIEQAGGRCALCGDPATTVHHVDYNRPWAERDEDLTPLCAPCHSAVTALLQRRRWWGGWRAHPTWVPLP